MAAPFEAPCRGDGARRAAVIAAVAAMVAVSALQRWLVLAATPYPIGVDGYFYPIQLRALLDHGALAYPSSPLTFWWLAPFAAATDPITGAKLGAALGCALVAVPAYGLGRRLGGGYGAGLVAAALATSSAGSFYLTLEFVKQGIGVTVGLAALWAIWAALDRASRARVVNACAWTIATLLAHKLAFALVVAVAAPAVVAALWRPRRWTLAALGLAAIVVLAAGAWLPQRLPSLGDLRLLGELFGAPHGWAPALVAPNITIAFRHEALLAVVPIAGAAIALAIRRDRNAFAWALVVLGALIAQPFLAVDDPQGLGFRLRIVAFVPLALCAATALGAVVRKDTLLAALAAALFVAGILGGGRTEGAVDTPPELARSIARANGLVPPAATVVVPERHILFMVRWYTGAAVSLRPDPVPRERRVRLFGQAFIGAHSPLDDALDVAQTQPGIAPPLELHAHIHNGIVLVTEPTWDWLLAHVPADTRAYFARWPTL